MKRVCSTLLLVALQVLAPAKGSSAQIAIKGSIVDPAGAPIEGAIIEVISVAADGHKAVTAKGRSSSDGAFRIEAPSAGVNSIRVSVQNRQPILIALKKQIDLGETDLGKIHVRTLCSDPGIICDSVEPKYP